MNEAGLGELYKALLSAQKAIKGVEKDSENSFQKYKYVSAEDMLIEARAALMGAGLAVFCENWTIQDNHVISMFCLVHAESGQTKTTTVTMPLVEEKGRPRDKAVTTALTYSLGYFLRGLLLVPRVEAGTDVDQRDDRSVEATVNSMAEPELRKVWAAVKRRVEALKPREPSGKRRR